MIIQCAECSGERFHLVINDDGSTMLACFNHGDHVDSDGLPPQDGQDDASARR